MAKNKLNFSQKTAIDLLVDTAIQKVVAPLEERISNLEDTVRWQKICLDRQARVCDDNRQYSNRKNLIIRGMDIGEREADSGLRKRGH